LVASVFGNLKASMAKAAEMMDEKHVGSLIVEKYEKPAG
jgi:hypothetical protein